MFDYEDDELYLDELAHHKTVMNDMNEAMMYDSLLRRTLGPESFNVIRPRKTVWIFDYWATEDEYDLICTLMGKAISDNWDLEYRLLLDVLKSENCK